MFEKITAAPADPILGLGEAFKSETRSNKINLGIGVYKDAKGNTPIVKAVKEAERRLLEQENTKNYLPIDGVADFNARTKELLFGANSDIVKNNRARTVQSLGGTGALRIAAEFVKRQTNSQNVWISTPTWPNHNAIFKAVGINIREYRYYDAERKALDWDNLIADLSQAGEGDVVLLHGCCHNPTGYDLNPEQWGRVIRVITDREMIPFLDMAYQGFRAGVAEDGAVISRFAEAGLPVFVSTSFSKSFGLYGERVGALHIVCRDAEEATRVLSQVKICIRTNYSNPSTHGAAIVAEVLGDPTQRTSWEQELGRMRDRIKRMRIRLVEALRSEGVGDMDFIAQQAGMFSYSGLTRDQMLALRRDHGIYGTEKGRMCVAALNDGNLEAVAKAIAAVRDR